VHPRALGRVDPAIGKPGVYLAVAKENQANIPFSYGKCKISSATIKNNNWAFLITESAGGVSMVLGIVIAIQGNKETSLSRGLDWFAIASGLFGIGYSLYYFGGIQTTNQVFEFIGIFGFLIGTYMLAKKKIKGYLWFILMNIATGILMGIQGDFGLTLQQAISIWFVRSAYLHAKKKQRLKNAS